jgi:hypothetical protein
MTATRTSTYTPPPEPTPMAIVGTILALGVIRLIEGQDLLDKLTEERVSTDVLTTKEKTP